MAQIVMKENPTNGEIKVALDSIIEKIDRGFEGVHERQDKTNGNVLKNTKFRWSTYAIISFVTIIGIGNLVNIFVL